MIDPHPSGRHKRFSDGTRERFESISSGTFEEQVLSAIRDSNGMTLEDLARAGYPDMGEVEKALANLVGESRVIHLQAAAREPGPDWWVTYETWQHLAQKAITELRRYHESNSLRTGMPREELKSRLQLESARFGVILAKLLADGILEMEQNVIHLPGHQVQLSEGQRKWLEPLMARFEATPYSPPPVSECILAAGPELYRALLAAGELVQVTGDVVFRKSDYQAMLDFVRTHLAQHPSLTVAEFRDHFHSSRKYALAFLEHLDATRVTIREGDFRRLRS